MIRNKTDAGNSIETSHEDNRNRWTPLDRAMCWLETISSTGSGLAEGQ
jgi:hypothetical protein